MTVAVYIRVSTDDQNPEGQRQEVQRWLTENGSGDVRWYEDKESGATMQRPAFERLQRAIRKGQVKTVVVWKLDRLSRSFKAGVKLLIDWLEQDVRIISVTQQIDLSGVVGQLIASVFFAMAEMELSHSKERQAVGIRLAKSEGKYKGRKSGTLKAKPERARDLFAKGFSRKEIAAALGVSKSTINNYLQSSSL